MIAPWPRAAMTPEQKRRAHAMQRYGWRVELFGKSAHGPWSANIYAWQAGQFLEYARMTMRDMDELLTWAEARVQLLEVRQRDG